MLPPQSIFAVDPGPTRSAWVHLREGNPARFGLDDNAYVRRVCEETQTWGIDVAAIEMIASYGMGVGAEVFETCIWIGRFVESLVRCNIPEHCIKLIPRMKIKSGICHSAKATDSNIRAALIDRFGGQEKAISGRRCVICGGRKLIGLGKKRGPCPTCRGTGWIIPPGPLAKISKDVWAALALAVTVQDGVEVA